MSRRLPFAWSLLLLSVPLQDGRAMQAEDPAKAYVEAARSLNEEHARNPGKDREAELSKRLPPEARAALDGLLRQKDSPGMLDALVDCGEAALDLDLVGDFERIRARLEKSSPERARRLGTALSRTRFILRGIGGLDRAYLEQFAAVMEAVLAAYDELFGFEEWSKVPGKKLRVRIHLEPKIVRPPHFAPEFPFHSEIDFPVADPKRFTSPTADGQFLFYGLCHELGHVIAMWGNADLEEDRHAWAHYTGVAVVEHLSGKGKNPAFLKDLKDVRWRSLEAERARLKECKPSFADRDGVLKTLLALHERVGPRAIGDAINSLDRQDRRLRINRVRYYSFKEFREGLLAILKDRAAKEAVSNLLPEGK